MICHWIVGKALDGFTVTVKKITTNIVQANHLIKFQFTIVYVA